MATTSCISFLLETAAIMRNMPAAGRIGELIEVVEMIDPRNLVCNEIDGDEDQKNGDSGSRRDDVIRLRKIDLIGKAICQRQPENGQERIETSRRCQQHSGQCICHGFTLTRACRRPPRSARSLYQFALETRRKPQKRSPATPLLFHFGSMEVRKSGPCYMTDRTTETSLPWISTLSARV